MVSKAGAARVYRDFEKLNKLLGFYEGQKDRLQQHLEFINNNLRRDLYESGDQGFTLELMMSRVTCDGEEIFLSDQPEMTMVYRLYSEGVKSITFRHQLTAEELLGWLQSIRGAILSGVDDLGTLLWKGSTPNIRVTLYNSLMQSDSFLRRSISDELEDPDGDISLDNDLIERHPTDESPQAPAEEESLDPFWDLPKAGHRFLSNYLNELNEDRLEEMRNSLNDISLTDRSKSIVSFYTDEVQNLRGELESFDLSHVEFNLILREFQILQASRTDEAAKLKAKQSLTELAASVIDRFHGGMILLFLQRLKDLSAVEKQFADKLAERLQEILVSEKNIRTLCEALGDKKRQKVAVDLSQYLTPVQWTRLIDSMSRNNQTEAAKNFLEGLHRSGVSIEATIKSWGRDRLLFILPLLGSFDWENKNEFLRRCLGSRFPQVAAMASRSILGMNLPPVEARRTYQSLDDSVKKVWLDTFLDNEISENWKEFTRLSLQDEVWRSENRSLMEVWIEVFLKYLRKEGLEKLLPWVQSRSFFFWATYPREREAIIRAFLKSREKTLRSQIDATLRSEKRLLFQSVTLKTLLKESYD